MNVIRLQTQRLCINCLKRGHSSAGCSSKHARETCQKRHHRLLHFPTETNKSIPQTTSMLVSSFKPELVLLSTLLVNITSVVNQTHILRALLDIETQVNFIIQGCTIRLLLPHHRCPTEVQKFFGVSVNVVLGTTTITMAPMEKKELSIPLKVYIVIKITDNSPQSNIVDYT